MFTTGITVQGGTQIFTANVRPRGGAATGAAAMTVLNNGTLLDFNGEFLVHRVGSGTTTVTFDGSGVTEVQSFGRRTSGMDMNILKTGTGTLTIVSFNSATAGTAAGTITGTTTINQGKIRIANEASLGGAESVVGTPLTFNAGYLTLNGGTLGASATLTIDDAHRGITLGANGGTLDAESSVTLTVSNVMTGTGDLNKTGVGSVVLTRSNTYVGTTTVSGGTLQVGSAGTGSIASAAAVSVESGSTLAGTGSVAGSTTVKNGAFLRAGDANGSSAGTFSLASSLTLNAGSTTTFQLATRDATVLSQAQLGSLGDPSLAGTDDFINITGALNTSAGSVIALDFTGYTATFGDVFNLFDFNAGSSNVTTPTFTVVGGSLNGMSLDTSRFNDLGVVAIVPEPSQLALLASGLLIAGWKRRRQR